MTKRIMVTLDDQQYELLQSLKGFGTKDAEKLRNIFIAYLSEKSYLKDSAHKCVNTIKCTALSTVGIVVTVAESLFQNA